MENKTCSKCTICKPESEFYFNKKRNKYSSSCKTCKKDYSILQKDKISNRMKEYRLNNKQMLSKKSKNYYQNNKKEKLDKQKEYYSKNKEKILTKSKIHYNKTKEEKKIILRERTNRYYKKNKDKKRNYRITNKEKINLKRKIRREENSIIYLKDIIRVSIYDSFKGRNLNKEGRTNVILGCSIENFKIYIESLFEPWMNWGNHGKYNPDGIKTWQLDHIIPSSSATTVEELIKLNHYTNFQPLESLKNILKSNKL